MERRNLLGLMGVGAAGLVAMGPRRVSAAQQGEHHQHGSEDFRTMAETVRICNETAAHCLEQIKAGEGQVEAHARNHEAVMDCQAVCALTAELMARHSPVQTHLHTANAEVCAHTAEVLRQSGERSDVVDQCIQSCQECERMCRRMAQQTSSGGR